MKCLIKNRIILSIFYFCFLVLSFVFFSTDVNALSISKTYAQNESISSGSAVFPNCDDYSCLSQFSYLQVDNGNILGFSLNIGDSIAIHGLSVSSYIETSYFSLNKCTSSSSCYIHFAPNVSFPYGSVTFTLLDSLGSSPPSGNIDITENGTFDISSYATATVNVPVSVVEGDYHDDLVSINNSILIASATILVIYFFYCIYRMIIRGVNV